MEPTDVGSITQWIGDLKSGDPEALGRLWERYFQSLVGLARKRLRSRSGPADGEDVALSAMNSLWELAGKGGLEGLASRDELWRLMVVITARKAMRQVASERRAKRGGGKVAVASELAGAAFDGSAEADAFAQVVGSEPTPEFAAMVAEEAARRIDSLPDETLRKVATLRLEGRTNEEVAVELGCVVRTVERKLDLIRKFWRRDQES